MYSIPSHYELGSYKFVGGSTSTKGVEAGRKAAASKTSHNEAERRRRKRINGHFDTLRALLPNSVKPDKASLLTEVVRHLRELKKTTDQLSSKNNACDNNDISQPAMFPTETDQLQLRHNKPESNLIKATLCCDDRPGLIADVVEAVRMADGNVVRAEMATVGSRTKVVLWAQCCGDEGVGKLGRGLKVVLDNKASLCTGLGQALPDHKMPRHYRGMST